jgi:hypothetical protein
MHDRGAEHDDQRNRQSCGAGASHAKEGAAVYGTDCELSRAPIPRSSTNEREDAMGRTTSDATRTQSVEANGQPAVESTSST